MVPFIEPFQFENSYQENNELDQTFKSVSLCLRNSTFSFESACESKHSFAMVATKLKSGGVRHCFSNGLA